MKDDSSDPEDASATALADDWSVLMAVTEQLNAAPVREATLQAFLLPAPQREEAEVVLSTIDPDSAGNPEMVTITIGAPRAFDATAAFVRAGCERCMIDLRAAPAGEVMDWFTGLRPTPTGGASVYDRERPSEDMRLARWYDAALFVRESTPSRPFVPAPAAQP